MVKYQWVPYQWGRNMRRTCQIGVALEIFGKVLRVLGVHQEALDIKKAGTHPPCGTENCWIRTDHGLGPLKVLPTNIFSGLVRHIKDCSLRQRSLQTAGETIYFKFPLCADRVNRGLHPYLQDGNSHSQVGTYCGRWCAFSDSPAQALLLARPTCPQK